MTQFQVLSHHLASQVEVSVLHAQVISAVGMVLNGERRCETWAENIQLMGNNLDVSGGHLVVFALSLRHSTLYLNTVFSTQLVGLFAQLCVISLIKNQLGDAISVAKVHEGHATHLA